MENIKAGVKVQYIGTASRDYLDEFREGKKGIVLAAPYKLESTGEQKFVDVEWFFERKDPKAMLTDKPGHVVNVMNLQVVE